MATSSVSRGKAACGTRPITGWTLLRVLWRSFFFLAAHNYEAQARRRGRSASQHGEVRAVLDRSFIATRVDEGHLRRRLAHLTHEGYGLQEAVAVSRRFHAGATQDVRQVARCPIQLLRAGLPTSHGVGGEEAYVRLDGDALDLPRGVLRGRSSGRQQGREQRAGEE